MPGHAHRTGAAYDDYRKFLPFQGIFNGGPDFFDIERIDGGQVFHTDASDHVFQHDFADGRALRGNAGAGVFLMTGHSSGSVIRNNYGDLALIINGIDQRRDAGV